MKLGCLQLEYQNATLAELYFGAYNSKYIQENLRSISNFKKNLNIYSDTIESAEVFGKIKSRLKQSGRIIDDFDILIASIAIANNCKLVTNNIRHFERISEIKLENWLL